MAMSITFDGSFLAGFFGYILAWAFYALAVNYVYNYRGCGWPYYAARILVFFLPAAILFFAGCYFALIVSIFNYGFIVGITLMRWTKFTPSELSEATVGPTFRSRPSQSMVLDWASFQAEPDGAVYDLTPQAESLIGKASQIMVLTGSAKNLPEAREKVIAEVGRHAVVVDDKPKLLEKLDPPA